MTDVKENTPVHDAGDVKEKSTAPVPSSQQLNPVARKLNKVLDRKLETDRETLDALQTLSEFYTENTLQNRRNLRRDIELRSLQVNQEFLGSFTAVKDRLDNLMGTINSMSDCCESMTERLRLTKQHTRDLLEKTTRLQNDSKRVDSRIEIANAFLERYQLNQEEQRALAGGQDGATVRHEFFAALVKARQIHTDCRLLVSTNHQRTGLEIMENIAQTIDAAYQLLFRWTQREFRLLNVDTTEVQPLLAEAIAALEDRPVLLKYALDEYCTARRNCIVRAFIDALTRGGPGGVPGPIELLSHDPLRYVADMLAWAHQATASEADHVRAITAKSETEVSRTRLHACLSSITEGLCRPLKTRIEQVMGSENGPVVLFKLSNTFKFYIQTMGDSLPADAPLLHLLNECSELTLNIFSSALSSHVSRRLTAIEPPASDLVPVEGVSQILLLLRDVLESHGSTLAIVEDKGGNYTKIFSAVIDPLVQTLLVSVAQFPVVEAAVCMLNCLSAVKTNLALFEYTDDRLEMLDAQMEAQCDVLVAEQASFVLQRTALVKLYETCVKHKMVEHGALSTSGLSGVANQDIVSGLAKFDSYLANTDAYQMDQLSCLQSSVVKSHVLKRTLESLIAAYEIIYKKLSDPENKFDLSSLNVKTTDQVKQVLC